MEFETILFAALQSSFLLGLLHGVNPCGHSWLVLAPFVTGEKDGRRVFILTCSFISGTGLACLLLGATIGGISQLVPLSIATWLEVGTSVILIILGLLLIYNPHLLHHHDDDDHHHNKEHEHGHDDHDHHPHANDNTAHGHTHKKRGLFQQLHQLTQNKKMLPFALFGIGFMNMIVPCPTAAIMYGYALNAGSSFTATLVFGAYAFSTAIAVGTVIFIIFKATAKANSLQKEWLEPLIMRISGGVIVLFSAYGLYQALGQ